MPRLRNSRTGVVVNVPEAKAAALGSEWGPAEAPANSEAPKSKSAAKREAAQAPRPAGQ